MKKSGYGAAQIIAVLKEQPDGHSGVRALPQAWDQRGHTSAGHKIAQIRSEDVFRHVHLPRAALKGGDDVIQKTF
jgi:hypothetical protein